MAIPGRFTYRMRSVETQRFKQKGSSKYMNIRLKVAMRRIPRLAVLLSMPGLVFAQMPDEDELDEIVVTATRMETAVRDVARSISVVEKDRIQVGTQQLGLDESLAGVPGLYMQNRFNFAQDLRISLRGFGARSSFGIRGIKVLVDGIPETLPDGQAGVDSIDLGSTQSIEVLRGPASSLYGNASGGVISISSELGSATPYVEGRLAGGDYGYLQAQLKSAGKFGDSDYLLNLARTEVDGYRDHSDARGSVLNSKLRVPLGDSDRLTFSLNLTDQPQADDPGGINAAQAESVLFDSGESLEQQRFGAVYERFRPAGNLTLRNYYVWREFGNRLPFVGGGAVDLERFFWGVGAQYGFGNLPDALSLTVGVDVDRQDDDRKRFDNNQGSLGAMVFDQNEQVDSNGIYLQSQYEMSDRWSLLAGLRYDEISYDVSDRYLDDGNDSGTLDFDEVSPSLAVNYRLDNSVLFASYSKSRCQRRVQSVAEPTAGR